MGRREAFIPAEIAFHLAIDLPFFLRNDQKTVRRWFMIPPGASLSIIPCPGGLQVHSEDPTYPEGVWPVEIWDFAGEAQNIQTDFGRVMAWTYHRSLMEVT